MSQDSIAKTKSMAFASRIVKMYQYLTHTQQEYVMSKQVLRSGTSIGANIAEALYGSSRKDFVAKLEIARKEAAETAYWLELLHHCDYISSDIYQSIHNDCTELISILTATIKSTKN